MKLNKCNTRISYTLLKFLIQNILVRVAVHTLIFTICFYLNLYIDFYYFNGAHHQGKKKNSFFKSIFSSRVSYLICDIIIQNHALLFMNVN